MLEQRSYWTPSLISMTETQTCTLMISDYMDATAGRSGRPPEPVTARPGTTLAPP